MFELITVALLGVVVFLWTRLNRAERRIEAMHDQVDARLSSLEAIGAAGRTSAAPTDIDTEQDTNISNERGVEAAPLKPRASEPERKAPQDQSASDQNEPDAALEPAARAIPARPLAQSMAFNAPEPPEASTQIDVDDQEEAHSPAFDFEDIIGRRLAIWGGGIALAVSGIFLVSYSIEAGLITPAVRVFLSFAFGLGLIAAAEVAFRIESRLRDPRVRQALAGAGLATLFGAFYLAGSAYGLIGPTFAFVGLAAVTAGAIGLSFRFGLPCAVLGLVGGFAAPVLVNSDSANVPLLALYLALVTSGLAWTGRKQGQRWLGYAAIGIGLGWGVLMQITGLAGTSDLLAIGGYLIVLGTVLPAFLYDREGPGAIQIIAGGVATLQMALLVSNAGFDALTWALYLLIGAALAGLGWRFPKLRPASAIATFIAVWLVALWPDPSTASILAVTVAIAGIFLAVPLIHQWRSTAGLIDIGQLALGALGLGAVLGYQFAIAPFARAINDTQLALCLALLALFPIAGFALRWQMPDPQGLQRRPALVLIGSAYILSFAALLLLAQSWLAPVMAAALAVVCCGLLWSREASALRIAAWTAIALTGLTLLATPDFESEALTLANSGLVEEPWRAVVRWAALVPGLIAMAIIRERSGSRIAADGLTALAVYGTLAQCVPGEALAWFAAAGSVAVILWKPDRFASWGAFLAIALAWSVMPLLGWLGAGALALAGDPFLANRAIAPLDIILRLAPAAIAATLIAVRAAKLEQAVRMAFAAIPAIFAMLALHSGFKQIFGITSLLQFEQSGMGERTIWQALVLSAGIGLARWEHPRLSATFRGIASAGLIGIGLLHFIWFSLLLHNPLMTAQNVGPTPLANWLLLAYSIAIAAVLTIRPTVAHLWNKASTACDIAVMGLITLMSISLLRQGFAGPILTATIIGSTESLLLSLLGIALALAFLWWGSRQSLRSWRIGSLVLILIAVLKVFLIDAAGLEGLLRIASFMVLGFSLIGIGWVYSRQLANRNPPEKRLNLKPG